MDAASRRRRVAVVMATVRCSGAGGAVETEYRGWRERRAWRVYVFARVLRAKESSWLREWIFTRAGSLPGTEASERVGRHSMVGGVLVVRLIA